MVRGSTIVRGSRGSRQQGKRQQAISQAVNQQAGSAPAAPAAPAPAPAAIPWDTLPASSAAELKRAASAYAASNYRQAANALLRADNKNALAMTAGALNTACQQGQALVKCWGKALDVKLWALDVPAGYVPTFRLVLAVLGLPVSDEIRAAEKQARQQIRQALFGK